MRQTNLLVPAARIKPYPGYSSAGHLPHAPRSGKIRTTIREGDRRNDLRRFSL